MLLPDPVVMPKTRGELTTRCSVQTDQKIFFECFHVHIETNFTRRTNNGRRARLTLDARKLNFIGRGGPRHLKHYYKHVYLITTTAIRDRVERGVCESHVLQLVSLDIDQITLFPSCVVLCRICVRLLLCTFTRAPV